MPWHIFSKHSSTDRDEGTIDEESSVSTAPRPGRPARKLAPEVRARIDLLNRKRTAILYDIEQGELARSATNPWTERIDLLTQALADIDRDMIATKSVEPGPNAILPPLPVTFSTTHELEVNTVTLTIGAEIFRFEEDEDWAERGHQVARTELRRKSGDARRLVSEQVPPTLRDPLTRHLTDSIFVLATDIRDRMIEESGMPSGVTLPNLARPCPVCGGWTDWRGTCQACARRDAAMQALRREQNRLMDQRTAETEERHRLAERLPLALRRLRDTEREIVTLTSAP